MVFTQAHFYNPWGVHESTASEGKRQEYMDYVLTNKLICDDKNKAGYTAYDAFSLIVVEVLVKNSTFR